MSKRNSESTDLPCFYDKPPTMVSDGQIWQTPVVPETSPIYFSINQPVAQKEPQKTHLGLFIDVFLSKVSHLFHTQTLSNWIVNLWWRLIIRPVSEVLMRSYFSWMTSPQITSGNSRLQVLTCFRVFLSVARGIKLSFFSGFLQLPLASSLFKEP